MLCAVQHGRNGEFADKEQAKQREAKAHEKQSRVLPGEGQKFQMTGTNTPASCLRFLFSAIFTLSNYVGLTVSVSRAQPPPLARPA